MTNLLTAAQMRAIEQAAIESGETTGLELMERAGAGVVEAILQEWPDMAKTPQKAVVLCGPGNNGGDGFVVARLLKQRGWAVEVFLYGEVETLPPDAKVNAERWLEVGAVNSVADGLKYLKWFYKDVKPLFVDAIFGTGLTRHLDATICNLFSATIAHRIDRYLVSIDLPSGVCSDSGKTISSSDNKIDGIFRSTEAFQADLTVTFNWRKQGHVLSYAADQCGKIRVMDIGLSSEKHTSWEQTGNWDGVVYDVAGFSNYFDDRLGKFEDHKFHHGHALILSGPSARTGAARLAARGALRIGAGVVSLGCPQEAVAECAAQLTAIMLAPIEDGAALAATLQDKRISALCLGPALGVDDRGRGLVEVALGGVEPHPTVLDADALTILAGEPELFAALHENCVLTPHAGEFKRLFPDIMAKLEAPATTGPAYSKVDATREAAARAGCVVLFKGADTVIASPDGRAAINSAHYERAAPWLATAGSGDVLAGFITGLMARGFAPMGAAETAAWLHVECALKFGPGLIAEDIPEQLPSVFRDLQL